ncbi:MAG: hypothetical protein ACRCUI_03220 [Polymorphobacter sp.]
MNDGMARRLDQDWRMPRGPVLARAVLGAAWLAVAPVGVAAAPPAPPTVSVYIQTETVVRIPAAPAAAPSPVRPAPPRQGRKRCIDVTHVAGAVVIGDQAVELLLNGGQRWRMHLAQGCPTLSFYQGFYYRRARAGKLCAGRDVVIARSGGECAIVSIVAVPRPKPR